MDAKEIGLLVKEFAEKLIGDNLEPGGLSMNESTQLVDHLGTALIMQGCMVMLEAGCPPDIVLNRAVMCVKGFRKQEAQQAIAEDKAAKSKIILTGN